MEIPISFMAGIMVTIMIMVATMIMIMISRLRVFHEYASNAQLRYELRSMLTIFIDCMYH